MIDPALSGRDRGLAGWRHVLGHITELSAVIANRRHEVRALDSGEMLPMSAPDQVLVSGLLTGGAPVSIHYRGAGSRSTPGFIWEINGSEGDIRVTGPSGDTQVVRLSLEGGRGDDRTLRPLEVPASYRAGWPDDVVPGNVARIYARLASDLRENTRTAPSFDGATTLHRLIASIEVAAVTERRVRA